MKDRIAVRAARWNSRSASGDRMLRSIPTIAPTKALTRTRRENCATLARRPSRTPGSGAIGLLTHVVFEVPLLRVHDGALAERSAAEDVRRATDSRRACPPPAHPGILP